MKKILTAAAICFFAVCGNAFAGDSHYQNTPEYKQLDAQMRAHLQECLKSEQMTTKQCIKDTKKTFKEQKKALKKSMH